MQQINNVYWVILIKILQIKTNITLINIYLRKLIQRLITNINLQKLNKVIATTIRRIRNNLISKKKSKIKVAQNFSSIKAKINKEVT